MKPIEHGSEMDEGEKSAGDFVVAVADAAETFEPLEAVRHCANWHGAHCAHAPIDFFGRFHRGPCDLRRPHPPFSVQ